MSFIKSISVAVVIALVAGAAWYVYQSNLLSAVGLQLGATLGAPSPNSNTAVPPSDLARIGSGRGPAPISAAPVTSGDDRLEIQAVGTIAANKAITMFAQVSGIVSEVDFNPGNQVKQGQTLFRLQDGDQQAALQKAKVALDSAQAAFDRSQQLAKANALAASALADAQTTLDKAKSDYLTAQVDLDKMTITAPFAGVVGISDVTVGDLVSNNKTLTTLDDLSTMVVAFDVPEKASGRVAVGQKVSATSAALPGMTFEGSINAVDTRVDPTARTLRVQAALPNGSNILKPGMAVTVTMDFPGQTYPVVPAPAVLYEQNGTYVWAVDRANNVVHHVSVDIIDRRNDGLLVQAALAPGQLVATQGLQVLRENSKVNIIDDGSGNITPTQPAASTSSQSVAPAAAASTNGPNSTDTGAAASGGTAGQRSPGQTGRAPGAPGAAGANRPGAGGAANGQRPGGSPAGTPAANGAAPASGGSPTPTPQGG